MPIKNADVYQLLVSCPSDAEQYLSVIERAVKKFNKANDYNFCIEVKHWKEDTYPELDNPQDSINNQLVDECDLDIAVFGKRLGTKTRNYISGTGEEIIRCKESGKQVFVYFYEGPKMINSEADAKELLRVEKFKKQCQTQKDIFYSTFQTEQELYNKFYDHLLLYFKRNCKITDKEDNRSKELALAESLYRLAQNNQREKNYNGALSLFEECRNIREKYLGIQEEQTLKALDGMIDACSNLSSWGKVVELRNRKLEIFKGKFGNNSMEVVWELEELGYCLDHFGEYRTALDCFTQALEILLTSHKSNEYEIAYARCGAGYIHRILGNYPEAIAEYTDALRYISRNSCARNFEDFVYNGIGSAYQTTDYELAIGYLKKAREIRGELLAEGKSELWKLSNTNRNIGNVYYYHKDYEKALEFHKEALRLSEKGTNLVNIGKCYLALAKTMIAMDKEEFDYLSVFSILEYLEKALTYIKEGHKKDSVLVADTLRLMARMYDRMGQYTKALEISFAAYKIYRENNENTDDMKDEMKQYYSAAQSEQLNLDDWLAIRTDNQLSRRK